MLETVIQLNHLHTVCIMQMSFVLSGPKEDFNIFAILSIVR